jgi:hypothetical protein
MWIEGRKELISLHISYWREKAYPDFLIPEMIEFGDSEVSLEEFGSIE